MVSTFTIFALLTSNPTGNVISSDFTSFPAVPKANVITYDVFSFTKLLTGVAETLLSFPATELVIEAEFDFGAVRFRKITFV